jgi:hypothetical protein
VTLFHSKIEGNDPNCEDALENVVDQYLDEMVDVRPYIWEYPFTVSVHDSLEKCL